MNLNSQHAGGPETPADSGLGTIRAMTQTARRDALVMVLTAVAGATNVLSLTALGGVPASIMTANLVIAGLSITHHEGALGWHAGVALAGFIVAVFVTAWLIRTRHKDADETKRPTWPRPAAIALAGEAVALAGVAVGWGVTGDRPAGAVQLVLCATAAFAMGIQSAAVRALEVAGLSSTFFTGTLTDTVRDLAGAGQLHWKRGAAGIAALIAGAAAEGAVLSYGSQRLGPVLPVALVCCVAALSLRGFSREG
jgi:uncharacterized membrane protein YoaK (UPF0700 family)